MTLGYPVQLRLNAEKHKTFEALAALENKPLATYLRETLEEQVALHDQFKTLHDDISILRSQIKVLCREKAADRDKTTALRFF